MGLTVEDLFPDARAQASAGQAGQSVTSSGKERRPTLSTIDLAEEKQLPWQFLFHLGVMDHPGGGVQIPYHLPDGALAPRHRIRTALVAREGSRWSKGEGKLVPYGLERLEEARKAGYLVIVEGESDCWTLWCHHFPALGLPGAALVNTLEADYLTGIDRVYIIQDSSRAFSGVL
jgi:putative DNA primase/helicase